LGCGGSEQFPVHGTVTFRGEPVPVGTVTLEPAKSLGDIAPTGFAVIENGRFETDPERGCVAGPHVARIVGYDGEPLPIEEEMAAEVIPGHEDEPGLAVGSPIFAEYTCEVDIEGPGSELELEVPAELAVETGQP
jgi:hypothetical protein